MKKETFSVETPPALGGKAEWRAYLIEHRQRLERVERDRAERVMGDQLSAHAVLEDWARVLVFLPWKGEPDLMMVWRAWHHRGLGLGLPVVAAREAPLRLVDWVPGQALLRDLMGLPVPDVAPESTSEVKSTFDTWVIPCVGVDRRGHRIGAGKGFYDRTLDALLRRGDTRPRTIGICFEAGRLGAELGEAHDLKLDAVITEAGWFDFPKDTHPEVQGPA